MLQVQDPGGAGDISPWTMSSVLPSPMRDKVGHLTTRSISGLVPFHLRCGLSPPCLRFAVVVPDPLRRIGPRTTQDSVPDCWLGFAGAAIADRMILCASRRTSHRTGLVGLTSGSSGPRGEANESP